ncbi:aldehyde dehydrogenase family protein [Streptomyces violaceusniger]|uniref:aldehyde dehydrogenase family protein n=1 Tax=Streptomyces violaceusniger TaxID=68280 RepID=UPI00380BBD3A
MHSVRRRWAAALLLVPLLAGCFAARDGSPYDAGAGAGGGRLRVAMAFPPAERFSPYGADATLLSRLGVTEGLTRLDGNGGAVPALAESWTRESGGGWVFTLREARFQDGTEVTPEAVAGALTHATHADPGPAALTGVTLTAEVVGERRVRVTTAAADSALPLRLSSPSLAILAPKAYRTKAGTRTAGTDESGSAKARSDAADGTAAVDPAGTATGPFTLARTGGATRATLHRFDDYWGGLAHASGLDVRFIADGTARTNAREDAAEVAEALITDPRVRIVNFTGSTGVGRTIGSLAAQHLKPAVLELGGKNAIIVLDDADVDHAVDAATFGVFMNSGQICMSGDRILVHESLAEEFTAKFAAKVAALPCGDPADPSTVVGPLVATTSARRVAALVKDAVDKGATVLTGGGEPDGAVHPATVLSGVTPDMDIHHAEAFGPVCVVATFADDDRAVALANATDHGLTCGIITENGTHGLKVARRIRTGIVHINDQSVADEPQAPFGGIKHSGYGRFGGRWGIEAFSDTRWITLATQHAHYPF